MRTSIAKLQKSTIKVFHMIALYSAEAMHEKQSQTVISDSHSSSQIRRVASGSTIFFSWQPYLSGIHSELVQEKC